MPTFCPVCKTLMLMGRCAFCSRPVPSDEGTRKQAPDVPPPPPANVYWKKCKTCGGKVSPRSKHEYCFECRGARDPAVAAEKEYDEKHPSE